MNFLYFLIGMVAGFFCVKFNKWLVEHSGIHWPKLENMIGPGSMYSIWKLVGVILICLSFYILFGGFGL